MIVSGVALWGICTADRIAPFSILTSLISLHVLLIASLADVCTEITLDL